MVLLYRGQKFWNWVCWALVWGAQGLVVSVGNRWDAAFKTC